MSWKRSLLRGDPEVEQDCQSAPCPRQEKPKAKIVVHVQGGCVQAVYSNRPAHEIEIELVDLDDEDLSRHEKDARLSTAVAGLKAIL